MKLEVGRYSIKIIPENEIDEAYIEEVLGCRKAGDIIKLRRRDVISTSALAYLETREYQEEKNNEAQ